MLRITYFIDVSVLCHEVGWFKLMVLKQHTTHLSDQRHPERTQDSRSWRCKGELHLWWKAELLFSNKQDLLNSKNSTLSVHFCFQISDLGFFDVTSYSTKNGSSNLGSLERTQQCVIFWLLFFFHVRTMVSKW